MDKEPSPSPSPPVTTNIKTEQVAACLPTDLPLEDSILETEYDGYSTQDQEFDYETLDDNQGLYSLFCQSFK